MTTDSNHHWIVGHPVMKDSIKTGRNREVFEVFSVLSSFPLSSRWFVWPILQTFKLIDISFAIAFNARKNWSVFMNWSEVWIPDSERTKKKALFGWNSFQFPVMIVLLVMERIRFKENFLLKSISIVLLRDINE